MNVPDGVSCVNRLSPSRSNSFPKAGSPQPKFLEFEGSLPLLGGLPLEEDRRMVRACRGDSLKVSAREEAHHSHP